MSRTKSLFSATAIVVGSSAAMLTGGIAKADPVPPPSPALPGINIMEQLIDPAKAPQLLQQATAMLTGLNATSPATPAIPASALPTLGTPAAPSLATASVNLPQPTSVLPGMPGALPAALPLTASVPGTLPGMPPAAVPAPAPAGLSTIPGLPIPLPANLPIPTDLAGLLPAAGVPAPNFGTNPVSPIGTAPAAAPIAPMPSIFPTSALP
ncbi:hypothetical protein [Mycolicibacterium komossense]|uniref:Uncharacterized protein n=1 Tax=Mycolicibacterium komossense TaxID=1779 RepID=A0ABT3CK79_9MYCO|nr:hypothetical protein [Mycolicibacterium komossense]MCV7229928.1 hypothetical protein [Mycolicibacterium komossense]